MAANSRLPVRWLSLCARGAQVTNPVPVAVAALCASDVRLKHARSSLDGEQGEYILELERAAAAASLAAAEAFGGSSAAGAHLAAAARMAHNDVHSQQARAWLLPDAAHGHSFCDRVPGKWAHCSFQLHTNM